jgi:hypothetical protein
LESAIWLLTIFVFICKKTNPNLSKQEVNGTAILPPLVFLAKALTDWGSGQLHESRLWGQHPAQEEEKEGVVPERDHGLDDPEDGLVVPEEVLAEGNVLLPFALVKYIKIIFLINVKYKSVRIWL